MPGVTVVLCPALDPDAPDGTRKELAAALAGWGVPVVVPHRASRQGAEGADERLQRAAWVSDQAVAITRAATDGPLIIVSSGTANRAVPALGFSQRASRRAVAAYVLMDGPLPDPRAATDWPDAPVYYIPGSSGDESLRAAELRGWTTLGRDAISAIIGMAKGWPDSLP